MASIKDYNQLKTPLKHVMCVFLTRQNYSSDETRLISFDLHLVSLLSNTTSLVFYTDHMVCILFYKFCRYDIMELLQLCLIINIQ